MPPCRGWRELGHGAGLDRRAMRQLCGEPRELGALATLLESGDVGLVIDKGYPFVGTASAISHMLGRYARGNVAIAINDTGG